MSRVKDSPLKIRGARGVMSKHLYNDPTMKSNRCCLREILNEDQLLKLMESNTQKY